MGQIKVTKAPIEGLYIIEPTVHGDSRGYFTETYNRRDMEEAGLTMEFVQDNQSMHEGRPPRAPFPEAVSAGQTRARHPRQRI